MAPPLAPNAPIPLSRSLVANPVLLEPDRAFPEPVPYNMPRTLSDARRVLAQAQGETKTIYIVDQSLLDYTRC